MRPGQKIRKTPGPDWGVRVIEPGSQAAAGGGWWDDFGAIGCCVGAYQGRGAANYAASLVNLANPGVNDLAEIGGGAVNWDAVNGWSGFLALLRCLDTGLIPAADQSWSALAQITGGGGAGNQFIIGARTAFGSEFELASWGGGASVCYANGGQQIAVPGLALGNLGVAGNQGYRNGVADGGAIAAWGGASTRTIYIGALNSFGFPANYFGGAIWAASFYDCTLTAPEVAAVAANMAAL